MKKIVFLLLCLTPLLLQAQSKARRGIFVGDPPDSMATIDSIKIVDDVLYFYVGTDTIFAALEDDLVDVDTVAHMLVDTLQFVFGAGAGNTGDSATFQNGTYLGAFKTKQDSILPRIFEADILGESGDSITIMIKSSPTGVGKGVETTIMAATGVGYDGGAISNTTFSVNAIGPDVWVWAEIVSVAGARPKLLTAPFFYTEKRAN